MKKLKYSTAMIRNTSTKEFEPIPALSGDGESNVTIESIGAQPQDFIVTISKDSDAAHGYSSDYEPLEIQNKRDEGRNCYAVYAEDMYKTKIPLIRVSAESAVFMLADFTVSTEFKYVSIEGKKQVNYSESVLAPVTLDSE